MIFKKIIFAVICFLSLIKPKNQKEDLEKYLELKIKREKSIKKSDLPCEFCEEAIEIVNEFIGKTIELDYEILLFFDYFDGEIIKCKLGVTQEWS